MPHLEALPCRCLQRSRREADTVALWAHLQPFSKTGKLVAGDARGAVGEC